MAAAMLDALDNPGESLEALELAERVEMAQPKVDEMTFTDDHGGQFS
jgi:hypothetical protein